MSQGFQSSKVTVNMYWYQQNSWIPIWSKQLNGHVRKHPANPRDDIIHIPAHTDYCTLMHCKSPVINILDNKIVLNTS